MKSKDNHKSGNIELSDDQLPFGTGHEQYALPWLVWLRKQSSTQDLIPSLYIASYI